MIRGVDLAPHRSLRPYLRTADLSSPPSWPFQDVGPGPAAPRAANGQVKPDVGGAWWVAVMVPVPDSWQKGDLTNVPARDQAAQGPWRRQAPRVRWCWRESPGAGAQPYLGAESKLRSQDVGSGVPRPGTRVGCPLGCGRPISLRLSRGQASPKREPAAELIAEGRFPPPGALPSPSRRRRPGLRPGGSLMAIVGAFGVHRAQLTYDYVSTETGEVRVGQIRPADRRRLRTWLARFEGEKEVV